VNGFHRNKTHVSDSDDDDLIQEDDRNVLILHSSGTTGLPKPIYLAHRYLLGYAACHRFAEDEVVNSPNVSDSSAIPRALVGDMRDPKMTLLTAG
jgi:acyl-coenzyme A synthetase/AMP-(fatty) acid ligase